MLEEVKRFCDTHHDSEAPHPCSKLCCAMKAPLACPALIQFRAQRVQRLEEFAQAGLKTGLVSCCCPAVSIGFMLWPADTFNSSIPLSISGRWMDMGRTLRHVMYDKHTKIEDAGKLCFLAPNSPNRPSNSPSCDTVSSKNYCTSPPCHVHIQAIVCMFAPNTMLSVL